MKPNQNFLKYFPDAELSESKNRTSRSSCLRLGTYFVLRKIIEECSLKDILGKYFGSRDMGLFLDLAVYSIIAENNAVQYYPDYTYKLKDGVIFRNLGAEYYNQFNKERKINAYLKELKALGWEADAVAV